VRRIGQNRRLSAALVAAASAWAAAAALAAPPRPRDIRVVDVTPTAFTVAWTADAPSTGGLEAFQDVLGASPLAGVLVEPSPRLGDDPAAAVAGEDLGVLRVRVTGLAPGTPCFFRTLTTAKAGGPPVRVPAAGALYSVVTELASFPETANGIGARVVAADGTTPRAGALLLVEVPGGSHPVSALAQDGYAPAIAAVDLANLYDPADGMTLPLTGGELAVITVLGGTAGTATATQALLTNAGLGVLQLLAAPLVLRPPIDTDGDGICDAINPQAIPRSGEAPGPGQAVGVEMAQLGLVGAADFRNTVPPYQLFSTDCQRGGATAPPPALCPAQQFDLKLTIGDYSENTPWIWTIPPIINNSSQCIGSQFDALANNKEALAIAEVVALQTGQRCGEQSGAALRSTQG